jgi:hypothetical protein
MATIVQKGHKINDIERRLRKRREQRRENRKSIEKMTNKYQ